MIRLMIDDMYAKMPWGQIDAVVFDVGNVLLKWQAQELLTQSDFRLVEADYEALTAVLHCRVLPREYQVGVTEAVLVTSAGPLPLLWQDGLFEGRMTLPLTEQV